MRRAGITGGWTEARVAFVRHVPQSVGGILCVALAVVAMAGLLARTAVAADPNAVRAKAELARQSVRALARSGGDPAPYLARMQAVGRTIRAGDLEDGERQLDAILSDLSAAHDAGPPRIALPPERINQEWRDPERVEIEGSPVDEMEIGFAPDESVLFFNDREKPDKDLHWAKRMADGRYRYMGEIEGVNTRGVDASPVTDDAGRIYYTSTHRYAPWRRRYTTMYVGRFVDGGIVDAQPLTGDIYRREKRWISLDTDVSPTGDRILFSQGRFEGEPPNPFDLVEAVRVGDEGFEYRVQPGLLDAINTPGTLQYAPSTSADGRELYFTRAVLRNGQMRIDGIYVARRDAVGQPWGEPARIEAITGVVEAPTVTRDGRRLYYHKQSRDRVVIYRVTRR